MIPISQVSFGREAETRILEVLRSGRLTQGPVTEEFEQQFAALAGTKYAIAVSTGTAALALALQAKGIGAGDEVITTAFSFVATLNSILSVGATAVLVDIDDDFLIDPDSVARAVTERTKAIMPVHLYGSPCDMPRIMEIATRHGLAVVEDAAQSHGAIINGQPVGSFDVACFSLYATKNVAAGEGGVITTDDPDVADVLRLLRNQGMRTRYDYELIGGNHRMTEIAAVLASSQLNNLKSMNSLRKRNAEAITKGLADVAGILTPKSARNRESVWHQYTIRVTQEAAVGRDELAQRLLAQGIATGIYYPRLMHDYSPYRGHDLITSLELPRALTATKEVLSLPVHPGVSLKQTETIANAVRAANA